MSRPLSVLSSCILMAVGAFDKKKDVFLLNKVILLGRLTRDPELKTTQSGIALCSFCVAVARRYEREKSDFFNCTAWRGAGETIHKYFKKGDMISIIGSIQNNDYTDSDNVKRRNTVVNVDEFYFASSQKRDAQNNAGDFSAEYIPSEDELPWNNN